MNAAFAVRSIARPTASCSAAPASGTSSTSTPGTLSASEGEKARGRRLERRDDDLTLAQVEARCGPCGHLCGQRADAEPNAIPQLDERDDRRPHVVHRGVGRNLAGDRDLPGVDPERDPALAGLQAAGAWDADVAWWALLVATLLTWLSGLDYARVAPSVLRGERTAS